MTETTTGASVALLDRTIDADSHEMAPSHFWGELFGDAAARIAVQCEPMLRRQVGNDFYNPTLPGDATEITDHNVWNVKGTSAPGAFDFSRRREVMDAMGIARQLVFPSFALYPAQLMVGTEFTLRDQFGLTEPEDEIRALGRAGIDEYNQWAITATAIDPDRIRCVAYIVDDGTVEDLVGQARDLIGRGIRAINIPPGRPPGGVSPADPALDEFWGLLEANDVPVVTHVGNEFGFLKSPVWGRAPAFKVGKVESHELGLEPYSFATVHLPSSHFIAVMVLGGVFERFPRLRFGAIEQGSSWLAPLADHLDMWARDVYATRLKPFISMLPSEYIARNVRVTPFNNFEPVEADLRRYPHLTTSYCYSTDYPHVEGGKDIKRVFYERIAPLGGDVAEAFFAGNAELLVPA